jgi:hypothetical protein
MKFYSSFSAIKASTMVENFLFQGSEGCFLLPGLDIKSVTLFSAFDRVIHALSVEVEESYCDFYSNTTRSSIASNDPFPSENLPHIPSDIPSVKSNPNLNPNPNLDQSDITSEIPASFYTTNLNQSNDHDKIEIPALPIHHTRQSNQSNHNDVKVAAIKLMLTYQG